MFGRRSGKVALTEERISQLMAEAGVTGRNLEALRNLKDTPALAASREWMESRRWALLISGGPGTGKTVAACALVHAYSRGGWHSRFIKAAFAAGLLPWSQEGKQQIDVMRQVTFLVLDDLGVETMTEPWRHILDDVIDYRYERGLRTALTTNLPPATSKDGVLSFRERYGARITDRLRHDSATAQCGDVSLRGRDE